jgi:hypothetical protein
MHGTVWIESSIHFRLSGLYEANRLCSNEVNESSVESHHRSGRSSGGAINLQEK